MSEIYGAIDWLRGAVELCQPSPGHIQEAAFVLQGWLPVMLNIPFGSHPGSEVVNITLRLPINGLS